MKWEISWLRTERLTKMSQQSHVFHSLDILWEVLSSGLLFPDLSSSSIFSSHIAVFQVLILGILFINLPWLQQECGCCKSSQIAKVLSNSRWKIMMSRNSAIFIGFHSNLGFLGLKTYSFSRVFRIATFSLILQGFRFSKIQRSLIKRRQKSTLRWSTIWSDSYLSNRLQGLMWTLKLKRVVLILWLDERLISCF